ncbi:MAG: regulatory protein GemA [Candidatus Sedimenticola sp. (ex Thyasira tokunagai)]
MSSKTKKSARTLELGKIHMGANQLGMDTKEKDPDSTYRRMLWTVGRVHSAADLDAEGRKAVLEHLAARGARFTKQRTTTRRKPPAKARLIYHIWNCLADAGVVENRKGLTTWLQSNTRREHPQGTGWSKPEFLPAKQKDQIIEQLKKWAARTKVEWK